MPKTQPLGDWGIHWFRRDLRVAGNRALEWNRARHAGRVVGFFCIDRKFLARPDFSSARFAFFLDTLRALRTELRESGGDLWVIDSSAPDAFRRIAHELRARQRALPRAVSFSRDYEPYAVTRDAAVRQALEQELGIAAHTERDHLIVEPAELAKPSAKARPRGPAREASPHYRVYTPFKKRWLALLEEDAFAERITGERAGLRYLRARAAGAADPDRFRLRWTSVWGTSGPPLPDCLDEIREQNLARVDVPIPEAGSLVALSAVRAFGARRAPGLRDYGKMRDYPAEPGTSRLSIYFKNGSLTTAQVCHELALLESAGHAAPGARLKFLQELIWREFYYHILAHFPGVEHDAFNPKFRDLKWENRPEHLEAWQAGRTGYPLVDAAMRQLNQTGWMHNRMRMVVASFLTKDLLVDWRLGERYFMHKLLDGDLAPNNGGWQWAASTGADPQPYFRIFNPALQSKRYDPEGRYIRRWVPELGELDRRQIHVPPPLAGYPAPIVDHAAQKARALALYRGR